MKRIVALFLLCAVAVCASSCTDKLGEEKKPTKVTEAAEQKSAETGTSSENTVETKADGLQNGGADTDGGWGALIPINGN